MRIIVISDSHRDFGRVLSIFERNQDADLFLFLGDGEREFDDVSGMYPHKKTFKVCGNCDFASFAAGMGTIVSEGKKIIFLHGHSHNVKRGTEGVLRLGRENDADIVLFGHTHQRHYSYNDGIHVMNPGSASCPRDGKKPSYAYIDITSAGIVCNHVDI